MISLEQSAKSAWSCERGSADTVDSLFEVGKQMQCEPLPFFHRDLPVGLFERRAFPDSDSYQLRVEKELWTRTEN